MNTTSSVRLSTGGRRRHDDHPEGMLAVTVILGVLGLGWFATCVWIILTSGVWRP